MSAVIVIGAGPMGLAAAYYSARKGHQVTLVEAAPEPGGMAAHFDLSGLSIERFYHFVCKADRATFDLLAELGLSEKMRWIGTSMGYFMDGRLYPWGDPVSLLTCSNLSMMEKLRYGAMMFASSKRRTCRNLENLSATDWITAWCGRSLYRKLWAPLLNLKFYEYADNISAAWLWTRIKRVGTSRRSLFQEELGYIDGGSKTLIDALVAAISKQGGTFRFNAPATRIVCANGRVTGVVAGGETFPADAAICTIPTPFVGALVPDMPAAERRAYDAIANIGVVCLVFRLRRSVTKHFWVNIADSRFAIPGIVEFSNLRPVGDTVVYVPYYMPPSHPKFTRSDNAFLTEAFDFLQLLNPELHKDDIVATHVGRLRHAQPVCPPGFAATLPPVVTSIGGLQIADTCFYYPEDRGISESVRFGKLMAERVQ
jgi:protoporphyrinogen oxidase